MVAGIFFNFSISHAIAKTTPCSEVHRLENILIDISKLQTLYKKINWSSSHPSDLDKQAIFTQDLDESLIDFAFYLEILFGINVEIKSSTNGLSYLDVSNQLNNSDNEFLNILVNSYVKTGHKVEALEIANESIFLSRKEELYDEQNFMISITPNRFIDVICSTN